MLHETTVQDVRLLEMDDGKVNFLSLPMRQALLAALQKAQLDGDIRAVVLAGRGSCFCAGMNVAEFDSGTALSAPSLHNEILDLLSEMTVPVVAAIHGGAHGGGLELALGCHYRVATPDAQVSLPEVVVGVMPGARGTQHLPRAIGLAAAADMILNGRRIDAKSAPEGLIDQLVTGHLTSAALAFAQNIAEQRPLPRLRDKSVDPVDRDLSDFIEAGTPDYPGTGDVISLLTASVEKPFAMAIRQEFSQFSDLSESAASIAFRTAFLYKLQADAQARRGRKSKPLL